LYDGYNFADSRSAEDDADAARRIMDAEGRPVASQIRWGPLTDLGLGAPP